MIKLNFIALLIVAVLINSATLFSAFEAHVVNVTATIERQPNQCEPKSPNYWLKNEGCQNGGLGVNAWADEINVLSGRLSGAFVTYDGAQVCTALWPDNCGDKETRAGKLCQAKSELLVNELNLVSGKLDPLALLAGADNGNGAFDHLGLSATSTIEQALATLERVVVDENIEEGYLLKARQVARRITAFYKEENPLFPQCVFEYRETEVIPEAEIIPDELIEVQITATSTEEIIQATTTEEVIENIEVIEVTEPEPEEVIEPEVVVEEEPAEEVSEPTPEPEPATEE